MQHPAQTMQVPLPALRKPAAKDGAEIWKLVRACSPLDENSMYCNLLQCDHFADTCVLADLSQEVVGWVSAYVMPNAPDTLFVWQVDLKDKAIECRTIFDTDGHIDRSAPAALSKTRLF